MATKNAVKAKNQQAALEYLRTGEAPEPQETEDGQELDEQLEELAEEQEASEEVVEEEAAEEEQAEKPEEKKPAKKDDKKPAKEGKKPTKKEEAAEAEEEVEEEAEEGDTDGNVADEDPNVLSEEVAALPRVQALLKEEEFSNMTKDVMMEGYANPYLTGENPDPVKALAHLRLERQDAAALYAILDGTLPAAEFLKQIETSKNPKILAETERIFTNITEHLGTNGFLQWYLDQKGFTIAPKDPKAAQPAAGAKVPNPFAKTEPNVSPELKPLLDKIAALEGKLPGAGNGQVNERGLNAEEEKAEQGFEGEIKRLMKEKGVPEDKFFADYKTGIVKKIVEYVGSAAVKQRIAKGVYIDVKRFFTEINNDMIARAEAYKKSTTTGVKKTVVTPKSSTNTGKKVVTKKAKAPVTPEAAKKARLDAALKALNESE